VPEARLDGPSVTTRSASGSARATLRAVVITALVAVILRAFVVLPFYIPSASMEPTLDINDKIFVSRLAYDLHPIHRGDIVVFVAPPSEQPRLTPMHLGLPLQWLRDVGKFIGVIHSRKVDFVKRVIGLPGDVIEARDGHVYIDDHELVEPYLPRGTTTSDFGPIVVPPGHLWVMGDNRDNSSDSRVFGPIPESSVIGRAFIRIWPLNRLAFI
jgi:signal peptidase I